MGSKTWGERTAVGLVVKLPLAMVIAFIMLLGFMFCSLCVVRYSLTVGWIGFTWTIIMMVLAIVSWVLMDHS